MSTTSGHELRDLRLSVDVLVKKGSLIPSSADELVKKSSAPSDSLRMFVFRPPPFFQKLGDVSTCPRFDVRS